MNAEAFEQKKPTIVRSFANCIIDVSYPSPITRTSISQDPPPSLDYILFEHSLKNLGDTTKNCFFKVLPPVVSIPRARGLLETEGLVI